MTIYMGIYLFPSAKGGQQRESFGESAAQGQPMIRTYAPNPQAVVLKTVNALALVRSHTWR